MEALYGYYQTLMFRVAFGILRDHHLAEDVVHECVIRLLRARVLDIDDLRAPATRKLVQIVARHQAYRQYTKHNKGAVCTADMDSFSGDARAADSDTAEIEDYMRTLPAIDREIILLRIYCGYSYKQVGALLGIRPQTARNRMVKIRKLLRRLWQGGEDDG